ncbi:MAG: cell division protein FtsZ [Candidatus Aenigmarchaeota archaeon]|nr:cell division protein FtsZ [Candidatus Aenigmarchaeota archaeon]MCK5062319.1 cell division protein FtsZ [Candidatus Aenigmarchaeota archaeon]MCK5234568.1 cell division protein FtsZ [Candidatus Aenigmarchaeota archaeon]MCK5289429.1 cell division protein FtsZ [Candidatus Aenigmarchaeota archaeon]MCK5452004.1 cell division protein FtsZ [Candidatus Aenigmarchaeota archaeon]
MKSFIESALAARNSSEQNRADNAPQNSMATEPVQNKMPERNTAQDSFEAPFASQEPIPQQMQPQHETPQSNSTPFRQEQTYNQSPFTAPEQAQQPRQEMPQQEPQTMSQNIQRDQSFTQPQQQQINQNIGLEDSFDDVQDARIMVIGAGGMGNNAVTRLHAMGIKGADTLVVNTDKQHLLISKADKKILIGKDITKGLGAGGYPNVGKQAAEESMTDLEKALKPADLVFIISGMGGGTGTGSAPIVSKIAKKNNAIVIGVVTMPFKIEGGRIPKAEEGLAKLRQECDTVIVIENDKLLEVAGEMPLQQAFAVADEIIVTMIKGITETISTPSIVNLDFADVKSVMKNGGVAVIGIGESSTAARARESVEEAMSNPLLDVDYRGATGALVHIAGGPDMKLTEIGEIGDFVAKHLDADASTIWGARVDQNMQGKIRVITIITGIKSQYILGPQEMREDSQDIGASLGIRTI